MNAVDWRRIFGDVDGGERSRARNDENCRTLCRDC